MTEPATKPRTKATKRAAATSRRARQRALQRDAGLVAISAAVESGTAAKLKEIAAERRCTLGQAVDSCVEAAEVARRRAAWRARVAAEGRQVVTVSLNSRDAALLKKWAADQRKKEAAAQRAAKAPAQQAQ